MTNKVLASVDIPGTEATKSSAWNLKSEHPSHLAADTPETETARSSAWNLEVERPSYSSSGRAPDIAIDPQTIRKANREVSKKIPPSERQKLMRDHLDFVKKAARGSLTNEEKRRFQMVRWTLDRIEDAQRGDYLDKLEAMIEAREQFAKDLSNLVSQFSPEKKKSHTGRPRRVK